jgi:hypothetical protein
MRLAAGTSTKHVQNQGLNLKGILMVNVNTTISQLVCTRPAATNVRNVKCSHDRMGRSTNYSLTYAN